MVGGPTFSPQIPSSVSLCSLRTISTSDENRKPDRSGVGEGKEVKKTTHEIKQSLFHNLASINAVGVNDVLQFLLFFLSPGEVKV